MSKKSKNKIDNFNTIPSSDNLDKARQSQDLGNELKMPKGVKKPKQS